MRLGKGLHTAVVNRTKARDLPTRGIKEPSVRLNKKSYRHLISKANSRMTRGTDGFSRSVNGGGRPASTVAKTREEQVLAEESHSFNWKTRPGRRLHQPVERHTPKDTTAEPAKPLVFNATSTERGGRHRERDKSGGSGGSGGSKRGATTSESGERLRGGGSGSGRERGNIETKS